MRSSILQPRAHLAAIGQLIAILTRHRELTWEMTRREIKDRYAGQALGVVWAIGHPLLLMALYVFVFAYVFPTRFETGSDMPRSFVSYILSGLIPWMAFAEAMSKGTSVITGQAALVKQVVFPTEILPVKAVLACFITQLLATGFLLVFMLATEHGWPATVVLLPLLFLLQLLAMIGVNYLLSSIAVYIRDLREVVQVFLTAGVFLAPIFYLPSWVERANPLFQLVLNANPFTHLVWCYRDVLYYGSVAHPGSWAVTTALSALVFYGGYRVFRKLKPAFGDAL
jgi:lipopolysaccharide transport system permease protein